MATQFPPSHHLGAKSQLAKRCLPLPLAPSILNPQLLSLQEGCSAGASAFFSHVLQPWARAGQRGAAA